MRRGTSDARAVGVHARVFRWELLRRHRAGRSRQAYRRASGRRLPWIYDAAAIGEVGVGRRVSALRRSNRLRATTEAMEPSQKGRSDRRGLRSTAAAGEAARGEAVAVVPRSFVVRGSLFERAPHHEGALQCRRAERRLTTSVSLGFLQMSAGDPLVRRTKIPHDLAILVEAPETMVTFGRVRFMLSRIVAASRGGFGG